MRVGFSIRARVQASRIAEHRTDLTSTTTRRTPARRTRRVSPLDEPVVMHHAPRSAALPARQSRNGLSGQLNRGVVYPLTPASLMPATPHMPTSRSINASHSPHDTHQHQPTALQSMKDAPRLLRATKRTGNLAARGLREGGA